MLSLSETKEPGRLELLRWDVVFAVDVGFRTRPELGRAQCKLWRRHDWQLQDPRALDGVLLEGQPRRVGSVLGRILLEKLRLLQELVRWWH